MTERLGELRAGHPFPAELCVNQLELDRRQQGLRSEEPHRRLA